MEGADAKRRRIARACDMCRKKKIKCDGKLPSCTHCVNYKTECVFTVVEKKRNPPKGAKYIEGLENRLGRMESLLKLSGLLPEGDENTDLGDLERRLQQSAGSSQRAGSQVGRSSSESVHTPTSSTLQSHLNSPAVTRGDEVEVETLSDQMCSLVTNNCGETRFIGSSSGFSIFSPKGIQWVNEKTGDTSFQEMIQEATLDQRRQPFSIWKQDMCGDIFDRQGKNPLPSKEKASLLIQDFFQGFNVLFPLFHRPSFEVYFEKQYTSDPPRDSGWYAALNIVLAISCRLRISHSPDSTMTPVVSHIQEAWKYFQNAAAVLTELLLRNTDLMSIQAILGMALFMQGTANPQPSYFLIAAAVRIATSIGMHRRGSSFGLNPIETEQRRRIFWILYMLDKDMALRSGRPPCINDDDCNVELPDENPLDGVGDVPLQNGKGKFNLFRSMINFAIIESKVYMQLYSAKASRQSDGELLNTIGDLDKELEEWKEAMPKEFSPDSELSPTAQKAKIMHVVILHFAYYNCLTTIHRMSIHHGYWTSRLSNYALAGLSARPLNPRVFSSAALCVSAARSTINLIKYLDPKDYPCIWLVMYYPVSALVTLFANILQNPQDVNAKTDLALIHDVVEFLRTVLELDEVDEGAEKFEDGSVNRMLVVCGEFERIAKLVQEKAEKEGAGKRKRKTGDVDGKSAQKVQAQRAVQGGSGAQTGQPNGLNAMGQSDPQQGGLRPIDVNSSASLANTEFQLFPSNLAPNDTSAFSPSNSLAWLNDVDLDPNTPRTNHSDTAGTPTGGPTDSMDPSQIGMMPGAFDQPFVPTDLWQMPMTFEWDWALDMGQTPWDGQNPL
ncbi:fungal-specific transcription factor domain-containing protein [Pyronema omphalodes]|nr:fungal-specific transcription factor domain-containing protein [Pyronema omphalodes]